MFEASEVFIAIGTGGDELGFAEVSTRPYAEGCETSPVAYLEGIFVIPSQRKMGIARHLIAAAEAWARDQGLSEMGSDTEVENADSIQMHKALAFAEEDRIICFVKRL
jgi:aminoglycoside 6'-N-acetyltransferase I